MVFVTTKVDDLIDRLEEIREEKGIPKEKFGPNKLGVSAMTYRYWTYGKTKPDAENLLKIVEYLEKNEK